MPKDTEIVEKGTPPEHITAKRDLMKQFTSGELVRNEELQKKNAPVEPPVPPSTVEEGIAPAISGPKKTIHVSTPYFKMTIPTSAVCISENGVAFFMESGIQFVPEIGSELNLEIDHKDYRVVYAGGFFDFPKLKYSLVSFMRVEEAGGE